ncbi:ester cyclase [Deinococcus sp.]|uniref:ester cyclase n=1 Tax=Deinococcus sp. TaxID=47478 RepID=UPI003C7E82B5
MPNLAQNSRSAADPETLARDHLHIVAAGDMQAAVANVTAEYLNHRSADEPLACRQRGPTGYLATIRWLHRAFTDLRFEVHRVVVSGDLVVLQVTLHGRQHGPFVVYDSPDARVTEAFPSNGRSFSARQTHWITVSQGAVSEHDAVRDDLAMAKQLGWIPPNPVFIARMLLALSSERRATAPPTAPAPS